jgi:hypothetical protein
MSYSSENEEIIEHVKTHLFTLTQHSEILILIFALKLSKLRIDRQYLMEMLYKYLPIIAANVNVEKRLVT